MAFIPLTFNTPITTGGTGKKGVNNNNDAVMKS